MTSRLGKGKPRNLFLRCTPSPFPVWIGILYKYTVYTYTACKTDKHLPQSPYILNCLLWVLSLNALTSREKAPCCNFKGLSNLALSINKCLGMPEFTVYAHIDRRLPNVNLASVTVGISCVGPLGEKQGFLSYPSGPTKHSHSLTPPPPPPHKQQFCYMYVK